MIIELFETVVPDSEFSGYRSKNQSIKYLFEDPSTKHVKLFALCYVQKTWGSCGIFIDCRRYMFDQGRLCLYSKPYHT
jgi:hypothetical protein